MQALEEGMDKQGFADQFPFCFDTIYILFEKWREKQEFGKIVGR